MKYPIGQIYRAKTGELLEALLFTDERFIFRFLHPNTMEKTQYTASGPLFELTSWALEIELTPIDIKTHIPTGLIPGEKQEQGH